MDVVEVTYDTPDCEESVPDANGCAGTTGVRVDRADWAGSDDRELPAPLITPNQPTDKARRDEEATAVTSARRVRRQREAVHRRSARGMPEPDPDCRAPGARQNRFPQSGSP